MKIWQTDAVIAVPCFIFLIGLGALTVAHIASASAIPHTPPKPHKWYASVYCDAVACQSSDCTTDQSPADAYAIYHVAYPYTAKIEDQDDGGVTVSASDFSQVFYPTLAGCQDDIANRRERGVEFEKAMEKYR